MITYYRAVVYGDNDFWRYTREYKSQTEAQEKANKIIKKYNVQCPKIVITENRKIV